MTRQWRWLPRPDARGLFHRASTSNVSESLEGEAAVDVRTIDLRERLRAPSPAIGAVILSRAPVVSDPWPVRAIGPQSPGKTKRVVEEVEPPERIASGWWNQPYDLVYRWIVSNDGARALFVRATPSPGGGGDEGGWRLVGIAD